MKNSLKNKRFFTLLVINFVFINAFCAFLENIPITLTQPDSSIINCYVTGDEFYSWLHDHDNYTIIQNPKNGYYEYAKLENNELVPSGYVVGVSITPLVDIEPGLNVFPDKEQIKSARDDGMLEVSEIQEAPKTGQINNIVIFVRFADQDEFTESITLYDELFNDNSSSLEQYFLEVSNNQLTITSDFFPTPIQEVIVSYQDDFDRSYYMEFDEVSNLDGYKGETERRDREHTLVRNVVESVSTQIENLNIDIDTDDDGFVDNICLIVEGNPIYGGTNNILWPHKWALYTETVEINDARVWEYNLQLSSITNVSVLCHEMFHTIGAPDLYHYSYDGLKPVASWDLMASDNAQHMTTWMKHKYGEWFNDILEITNDGSFTLAPVSTNPFSCYKIPVPNKPDEFFIIEYRDKNGFDANLPFTYDEGLLVYRINTTIEGNSNGPPDEVYVLRPDVTTNNPNGTINDATFSDLHARTILNSESDPAPVLNDGTVCPFEITNVQIENSQIKFDVNFEYENYEGWDIAIDENNHSFSPSSPNPGSSITVDVTVKNVGIYTYSSVLLKSELLDNSGKVQDTDQKTMTNLVHGMGYPTDLQLRVPSNASDGNYKIITSVITDKDEDYSNNTSSRSFYIGENLPNDQFTSSGQSMLEWPPTQAGKDKLNINGEVFTLSGINTSNCYIGMTDPSGDFERIDCGYIEIYGSLDRSIAVESVADLSSTGYAWVYGGYATSQGPTFSSFTVSGEPGSSVYFYATVPSGLEFEHSDGNYEVWPTSTSREYLTDWYNSVDSDDGYNNIEIKFKIPSNASLGEHKFYFMTEYETGSRIDFTRLVIKVVAPLPEILTISSENISADDELTITGSNFGSSGTLKFGDIDASQIISWSNTSIRCIVPEGISSSTLKVINSGGTSNGVWFNVISDTGDPILIQSIPDLSMVQDVTKTITILSNNFSDPNNDELSYSVIIDGVGISYDEEKLSSGLLELTTTTVFISDATITVYATDEDNATITDEFTVFAIETNYSISGKLNYGNSLQSPLSEIIVTLYNSDPQAIGAEVTDENGFFLFPELPNDDYEIAPYIEHPWEGVTVLDLLKIMMHIGGQSVSSPFNAYVGDVNEDGYINVQDVLRLKYKLGDPNNYVLPIGNWYYENIYVTVNNSDVTQDVTAYCFGDVDGSNLNPLNKSAGNVLIQDDLPVTFEGDEILVPFRINKTVENLAAAGLTFTYPESLLEVKDIQMVSANEDLYYTAIDGTIRIVFATLNSFDLDQYDALFTIRFGLKENIDNPNLSDGKISFSGAGDFANANAKELGDIKLLYSSISQETILERLAIQNIKVYPNPANKKVNIANAEKSVISVYNLLGRKLKTENCNTNLHTMDISDLAVGSYFIRIEKNNQIVIKKITVSK